MEHDCNSRLEHLWDILKDRANYYELLEKQSNKISKQFEQLIQLLMAQEHKVKGPITLQMEQTRSTINNIINEISDINSIINRSRPPPKDNSDTNISKVIQSITTCSSVDEFIQEDDDDNNNQLNDNELMLLVKSHAKHMELNQYDLLDESPSNHQLETIKNNVRSTKDKIQACIDLIEQVPHTESFHNHIFSRIDNDDDSDNEEMSFLSLETNRHTKIKRNFGDLIRTSASTIYARGNVYYFGGDDEDTFMRYTIADGQLLEEEQLVGIPGGDDIGLCYDGDKLIYLVGGLSNDNFLTRVDSFNIDTHECKNVGRLPFRFFQSTVYYHNNTLYVFNADAGPGEPQLKPMAFNLLTKVARIISNVDRFPEGSTCFDGKDNIYILYRGTNTYLVFRFTLSTKQLEQ
ncbi:hypothetical protein SAMD00019534_103000 [Acytostelium subglobosum LB1]|uniref:hypothetical protein n=1 Tax=Acytostelium subglobosum LB1 TaxID=1410327 RepID=UPI0006451D9E|nr:hypothetical protein SAMD00019534_103000 [Acytostelium subglobosum LB1]GAM27125.1 hypothetical protein SAMD00019534_103000 [Acytostelium subglobosum LB1]|eukprot:XP_012750005.1 hypothetical protein SAMD00019534_103000 [Acytostelium subglobosum LB1]